MTENLCVFNLYLSFPLAPEFLSFMLWLTHLSLYHSHLQATEPYSVTLPFLHLEFVKCIGYEKKKVFQMKETK